MPAVYYDSYPPTYSNGVPQNRAPPKEEETEQEASLLLLSLKFNRSVTPDPDSEHHVRSSSYKKISQSSFTGFGYDPPYMEPPPAPRGDERANLSSMTAPPTPFTEQPLSSSTVDASEPFQEVDVNYQALVEESSLVVMKDRDLVPDALFVAMAQMKPCELSHADRVGCYKNRDLGFLGMCCKHCGGQPGFGRFFPNSVRSLAQTTTSQTILKHIGNKCRFCPPHIRNAVLQLQQQNSLCEGMTSGRPRYGSRKIFFQRVWARLHQGDSYVEEDDASTGTPTDLDETSTVSEDTTTMPKRKNRFGALPLQKNKRIKTTVALV